MMIRGRSKVAAWLTTAFVSSAAIAQLPNHPVLTEVYTDPVGANDAPVGRDVSNLHQEYIEFYLPTADALDPALNKNALKLTFYEVEGDLTSTGLGLVNYRFDLPVFDLDPSNGITPGALPRPASGVVVLGWVDYVNDPPTDLAGTPSSRVALINGGVTSTSGFTFIAINGNHFSGTTNFPTVLAESLIDVPNETRSGVIQNGSGVYLLVDRDAAGYVELFDDKHVPGGQSADPALDTGSVLGTDALLDGFAVNDHDLFDTLQQPYDGEGDDEVDLETVLPLGGAYSRLTPQVAEIDRNRTTEGLANGYKRVYPDVAKTTENGSAGDDDPVADALNAYRQLRNTGPFYPTPGKVAFASSPAELSVADSSELSFAVLTQTTAHPAVLTANIGGAFAVDISVNGGVSDNPSAATFGAGVAATGVTGQSLALPTMAISTAPGAVHGQVAHASVDIVAVNTVGGAPAVVNATQQVAVTATILSPTNGLDPNGLSFQTTVFVAIQPLPSDPGVLNELLGTDLGAFLVSNLGGLAQDTRANGATLLDPTTDWSDPNTILPMVKEFPTEEFLFQNPAGPTGRLDFGQTILNSAEVLSGSTTYDESFDPNGTAIRAVSWNVPDTFVFGGTFSPSERIHFADEAGFAGAARSGLTDATTSRTFEIVLIDTNLRQNGTFETGATDDFGIVIEVELTEPGSPVVDGEFVFLSFTGGLQGADIDTLQAPDRSESVGTLIYLDLDNLHDVLGIISIERLLLVEADSAGPEADIIEAFSLNPFFVPSSCGGDLDNDGDTDLADLAVLLSNFGTPSGAMFADGDLDGDGDVDLSDLAVQLSSFGCTS